MKNEIVLSLILIVLMAGILGIVWTIGQGLERDLRANTCLQAGYASILQFAGEYYCVKLEDGLLIGVSLDDIDLGSAVVEPGAYTIARWQ